MPSRSPSPCGEPPARPVAIRRASAKKPKPSSPTEYNLEEAVFWMHRHLPAGSVVEFQNPYSPASEAPASIAALVVSAESQSSGIWAKVKVGEGETQRRWKVGLCKAPLPCSHFAVQKAYSCMSGAWEAPLFQWMSTMRGPLLPWEFNF